MNVEDLLSPSGNKGYDQGSGHGLLGFALGWSDSGLASKLFYRPMFKGTKLRRQSVIDKTVNTRKQRYSARYKRGLAVKSKIDAGWQGPLRPGEARDYRLATSGAKIGSVDSWRKEASASMKGSTVNGKYGKSRVQKERNLLKKAYQGHKKFFGRVGWAMFLSFAMETVQDLTTPGISKLAAARDQSMFADESVIDSAAASTMRQRSLQAIYDSQMTTRQIIGNEASYMHR